MGSVLRMIIDSLIYEDLDKNMSNSNVGARKQRNIHDHLFMVHGIINSILNGEETPIDIQIYDMLPSLVMGTTQVLNNNG